MILSIPFSLVLLSPCVPIEIKSLGFDQIQQFISCPDINIVDEAILEYTVNK